MATILAFYADDAVSYENGTLVPLLAGLTENYTYPITTKSKVAQRYFDQGLILSYGFNHVEAARSFKEAIRHCTLFIFDCT